MTEEKDTKVQDVPPAPTEPDNSTVKNSALFQNVTAQLAHANKQITEREEADAAAKTKAAAETLEAAGKYKEALAVKDTETARLKAEHVAALTSRDLATALLKADFRNDTFVAGAIAGYDPKVCTVGEYVKALASDEANKIFITNQQNTIPAPGTPTPSGGKLTPDQLKQMAASTDRDTRLKAIEYKRAQYANGALNL